MMNIVNKMDSAFGKSKGSAHESNKLRARFDLPCIIFVGHFNIS